MIFRSSMISLGQGPPNDRIKQIKLDQRISVLTYTIMASLSAFGIFLAIGFFVFNIIFRTHRWAIPIDHLFILNFLIFLRFIRMSSPQINNLILAGCILSYTSILLMGIDSTLLGERSSKFTMNIICAVRLIFKVKITDKYRAFFSFKARIWTLSIGFTVSFGAILSKTWRVHTIFTNVNASKRVDQ